MQLITVQRAMVMGSGGSLGFGLNPIPCLVQGGPSALGKGYVDSKFEVAFSCKLILWPRPTTEL